MRAMVTKVTFFLRINLKKKLGKYFTFFHILFMSILLGGGWTIRFLSAFSLF